MAKKIEHILYLRTDLTTQKVVAGGSIAHTLGVVSGLLQKGVRVIAAASFMAEQIEELGPDKVRKLTVPRLIMKAPWRLVCMIANIFYFFQILSFTRKERVDAIYQRYSLFNCVGVLVSLVRRIPLILEYNGSEVWVDANWGTKRKWGKLLWLSGLVEKLNIRYASSIVVVSQVLKEDLVVRGIAPEKILVNPNGVNTDIYQAAVLTDEREQMRQALGCNDAFVFGFIGTFSIWHGIDTIERMIPQVIQENEKAHFLMIGDGPLRAQLIKTLSKNPDVMRRTTFTGAVPQHEAKKYLAACDAYLAPNKPNEDGTRFFGSPTKLFEYMSMGKPIIASDLEQLTQVVSPAVNSTDGLSLEAINDEVGVLVPPTDVAGFIAAARAVASSPIEQQHKMGDNARKLACSKYSWTQHVHKILHFSQTRVKR